MQFRFLQESSPSKGGLGYFYVQFRFIQEHKLQLKAIGKTSRGFRPAISLSSEATSMYRLLGTIPAAAAAQFCFLEEEKLHFEAVTDTSNGF